MPSTKTRSSPARRTQVPNACATCRQSKVKCSGERPECSRCQRRGIVCSYEILEEGMTKRAALSRELDENREQLRDVQTVLDVMRRGSDMLATETLAQLRMGIDVEQVLNDLRRKFPSLPEFDLGEMGSIASQKTFTSSELAGTASGEFFFPSSSASAVDEDQETPLTSDSSTSAATRQQKQQQQQQQQQHEQQQTAAIDPRLFDECYQSSNTMSNESNMEYEYD